MESDNFSPTFFKMLVEIWISNDNGIVNSELLFATSFT